MGTVRLLGQLICATSTQALVVAAHLPLHVDLTRAERGCIAFEVTPTDDPLVWNVDERFHDEVAIQAHQDRVATSDWGRMTAGIERRYSIERA